MMKYTVLIVPSGIETFLYNNFVSCHFVLIVPSGIETAKRMKKRTEEQVLIVPSGIETLYLQASLVI